MPRLSFPTAFGSCALAWDEHGVTGFSLPPASPRSPAGAPTNAADAPADMRALIARVQAHLAGRLQDFADVAYDFARVSDFNRRVYVYALTVKAGATRTYGDVAAALGLPPGGARAVGAALGANPWPLLVPCHRFVGASGRMTGFSAPGGVRTKTRLLALEGAELLSE